MRGSVNTLEHAAAKTILDGFVVLAASGMEVCSVYRVVRLARLVGVHEYHPPSYPPSNALLNLSQFPDDARVATVANKGLTTVVSEDMDYFSNLAFLDISENALDVQSFATMPALVELRMAANCIERIQVRNCRITDRNYRLTDSTSPSLYSNPHPNPHPHTIADGDTSRFRIAVLPRPGVQPTEPRRSHIAHYSSRAARGRSEWE